MKIRLIACHGIAALIGTAMTTFLVLLLDRRPPAILYPELSSVTPSPARPGETVAITWTVRPERACEGEVIPRIIDSTGRIFEYAPVRTVYQKLTMNKEPQQFSRFMQLPAVIPPGRTRYEAVVHRWCNLVQQYLWPLTDAPAPIPFMIAADAAGLPPGPQGPQGDTGPQGPQGEPGPTGPRGP